jgi:hypothetical protein
MRGFSFCEEANLRYFVEPETEILKLDDYGFSEQWVEVKAELSHGESEDLDARTLHYTRVDGEMRLVPNHAIVKTEYLLAYVVAWSFVDNQDPPRPVPVDRSSVRALAQPLARAIDQALAAHLADASEKKATPTPKKGSTRTSR